MPLTPAEIHNIEFGKASLGKRGYDEEQVDTLLDEITQEMIRLLEENNALQNQLPRNAPQQQPSGPSTEAAEAAIAAAAAELDRARRACDQAEQNARQVHRQLEQARPAAAAATAIISTTSENQLQDRVLAAAQRTADNYLQDAGEESQALIADTQLRCDRLIDDARRAAGDIEQNAHRQHSEAVATLTARRADLLREISDLTKFAADYHAALQNQMARQGRLLDGTAEPL
ncbi:MULTISPECIES: DivIVA domain-containing protein [Actinoplanes]|uniref:Cell wall synthesis protein Wag31 n=2 Tax=Actinoplanes TaxID=1865 RepID=A0A117MS10_9ACTN|nr:MULTISPECIES: DivIVA domain-containing protein [Actinoplanes]KUL32604.1 hypothetical protein ADL15_18965 [Actinoplanes awajinensis subsp. mycoplanecinus]GIE70104.1 cell wall synthesis protein Wag31 [Actinoplanes palleronii]